MVLRSGATGATGTGSWFSSGLLISLIGVNSLSTELVNNLFELLSYISVKLLLYLIGLLGLDIYIGLDSNWILNLSSFEVDCKSFSINQII